MLARHLEPRLREALADTPAVLLVGARQVGKTTLARSLVDESFPAQYLTLDEAAVAAAAEADPDGFVRQQSGPVILDEIQRVPALLPAIKTAIDRDRTPGRFLLTGSANVLALPRVAESLVGRVEVRTLWPLSRGEIEGRRERFLRAAFEEDPPAGTEAASEIDWLDICLEGGYPEVQTRSRHRREAWLGAYVDTLLVRDVRDLAAVENLNTLPLLLELLAHRATRLLNYSEISRSAGIPQTTLKRYMALFEHTFLLHRLPAWARNPTKRLVKSPKLHFVDTGVLAHLARWTGAALPHARSHTGPLLENLAAVELLKQISWSRDRYELSHFRTSAGREVDLVLENAEGRLVGLEIKSGMTVNPKDFKGLEALEDAAGRRFHRGRVLYGGSRTLPFGRNLWAVPLVALWE